MNTLSLDDTFGEDNVEVRVKKTERRRRRDTTAEAYEWVVVVEYVLRPTPSCPVEVLKKAEVNGENTQGAGGGGGRGAGPPLCSPAVLACP